MGKHFKLFRVTENRKSAVIFAVKRTAEVFGNFRIDNLIIAEQFVGNDILDAVYAVFIGK